MKSFFKRLSEPFPDRNSAKQNFKNICGVGLFVALFLFIIRPFGISGVPYQLLLVCLAFGVITVVFALFFDLVCYKILNIKTDQPSWTLGKWMLQSLILMVWIAFGNYLFIVFLSGGKAFDYSFFKMIGYTIVVGIFPIAFSGILAQLKAIKENSAKAADLHPKTKELEVTASPLFEIPTTEKAAIQITTSNFLFAESMQNYLSIYFLDEKKRITKEVIRNTMSALTEEITDENCLRCHRSFLVNINQVSQVSGNAQGLKLEVCSNPDYIVPVSRSYIPVVKEALR